MRYWRQGHDLFGVSHRLKDFFLIFLGHELEDVRRRIRPGLIEDQGQRLSGHLLGNPSGCLRLHLFQDVGGFSGGNSLQQLQPGTFGQSGQGLSLVYGVDLAEPGQGRVAILFFYELADLLDDKLHQLLAGAALPLGLDV